MKPGPRGPEGPEGPQGQQGHDGLPGLRGDRGEAGPAGRDGADGAPGNRGEAGPRGIAGERGPKGEKGDPGPKGDQGDQGAAGVGIENVFSDGEELVLVYTDGLETRHKIAVNVEKKVVGGGGWVGGGMGPKGFDGLIPSPDIEDFAAETDVLLSTRITSDASTIDGDAGTVWPVIVRGDGSPQLEVNGDGNWVSSSTIIAGDSIKVRLTSSAMISTESIATLHAQGTTKSFQITTVSSVVDSDAQAFLTAAGITDPTEVAAVSVLVVAMKTASIWSKMQAVYPFVGGTADTHKWNLADPRDLDAAFRISWTGGLTHASTGITPDGGSNSYGDTHYVPNDNAIITDCSLSWYSRTQSDGSPSQCDMGAYDPAITLRFHLIIRYEGDLFYYGLGEEGSTASATPSTDSRGLFANSRFDTSMQHGYRNGVPFGTPEAVTATALPTQSVYLGRLNDFSAGPSTREFAFCTISRSLTDADQAALYSAVQAFQTTLGRQV